MVVGPPSVLPRFVSNEHANDAGEQISLLQRFVNDGFYVQDPTGTVVPVVNFDLLVSRAQGSLAVAGPGSLPVGAVAGSVLVTAPGGSVSIRTDGSLNVSGADGSIEVEAELP